MQDLLVAAASPTPGLAAGAAANTLVYTLGIKVLLSGLTWQGVLSSWVLGTLTYAAFGPGAYAIVCVYFIVGSLVRSREQGAGWGRGRAGRRAWQTGAGSGLAGWLAGPAAHLQRQLPTAQH